MLDCGCPTVATNNSLCEGDFAYKNITDENEPKRKGTD